MKDVERNLEMIMLDKVALKTQVKTLLLYIQNHNIYDEEELNLYLSEAAKYHKLGFENTLKRKIDQQDIAYLEVLENKIMNLEIE